MLTFWYRDKETLLSLTAIKKSWGYSSILIIIDVFIYIFLVYLSNLLSCVTEAKDRYSLFYYVRLSWAIYVRLLFVIMYDWSGKVVVKLMINLKKVKYLKKSDYCRQIWFLYAENNVQFFPHYEKLTVHTLRKSLRCNLNSWIFISTLFQ